MTEQLSRPITAMKGQAGDRDSALHDETSSVRASRKPKVFRLLDLPPELWVKIGKLVVDECPPVHFKTFYYPDPGQSATLAKQPHITLVCVALRHELLPYYYQTKIELLVNPHSVAIGRWLRAIGQNNRRDIRGLKLGILEGLEIMCKRIAQNIWKVEFEIGPAEVGSHNLSGYHRVTFL